MSCGLDDRLERSVDLHAAHLGAKDLGRGALAVGLLVCQRDTAKRRSAKLTIGLEL